MKSDEGLGDPHGSEYSSGDRIGCQKGKPTRGPEKSSCGSELAHGSSPKLDSCSHLSLEGVFTLGHGHYHARQRTGVVE